MKRRKTVWFYMILVLANVGYYFIVAQNKELDCTWIILATLPIWFFLLFAELEKEKRKRKVIKGLGIVGCTAFIVFFSFIFIGGREQVQDEYSYIVVLGNGFSEDGISQNAKNRLDTAYEYGKDKDVIYVVAGGLKKKHTEAFLMKEYLREKGVSDEKIVLEDHSTDTYENLCYAYEMIGDQRILLVTNRFHLWRSVQLAKSVGFTKVQQTYAPTVKMLLPYCYMREIGAIVREVLRGRIPSSVG